jgi:hypothetical protein
MNKWKYHNENFHLVKLIYTNKNTLNYKVTINQKAWYWHKNRHIEQWDKINSPEINSFMSGEIILD